MESSTEILRRLLDERGVEWAEYGDGYTLLWYGGREYTVQPNVCNRLIVTNLTPEQAIAATLGRGECHKLPASGEKTCIVRHNSTHFTVEFGYWRCSECGCECFEGARYCMGCGARVVDA